MKKYRKLRDIDIVRSSDEVKQQFPPYEWTTSHGYAENKVKDCYGSLTKTSRIFRRLISDK